MTPRNIKYDWGYACRSRKCDNPAYYPLEYCDDCFDEFKEDFRKHVKRIHNIRRKRVFKH